LRDFKTALTTITKVMSKYAADKFLFSDMLIGFNKLKESVKEIVKGTE
jgi:hypothetical protein